MDYRGEDPCTRVGLVLFTNLLGKGGVTTERKRTEGGVSPRR